MKIQFLDKIEHLYFLNGELISFDEINEPIFSLNNDFINLNAFLIFFKIKDFDIEKHTRDIQLKINACLFRYEKLNIDISQKDFLDIVPYHLVDSYAKLRNEFYSNLISIIENNENFDKFFEFYQKNKEIFDILPKLEAEFDFGSIKLNFAENFRFKNENGHLNLLNLRKENRDIVKAPRDYFIYACDYKQFEFRTFLKLLNFDSSIFSDNLYEKLGQKFGLTSENIKQEIIVWMYSNKENLMLDRAFDKRIVMNNIDVNCLFEHRDGIVFTDPSAADNKNLHTIIQTMSQFFYLRKLNEVLKLLKGKQSKFIYPLHDSMIFMIHKDETELLNSIPETLESDVYKIKQYIGKNYRDIEEI